MVPIRKQATGRVYYYTQCRTCIDIRKTHPDPQYKCVWCSNSFKLTRKGNQTVVEIKAIALFMVAAALLFYFICYLIQRST